MRQKGEIIVSVVTIVYNDVNHIETTIKSVLEQDYPYVDYIVVDGKSTDGTVEIIKSYASQLRYISESDTGIYNAMNKGLNLSVGDYVIFMNCGDKFSTGTTISEVISNVDTERELPALIYGNCRESNEGAVSTVIPARHFSKVWYGTFASHQSTFYNRHFLSQNGLTYDESYRIAADYKMNLEVVKYAAGNILQTSVCVSDFDVTGISNLNQDMGLYEADRARQEVLAMGYINRKLIIGLQLCARWMKKNLGTIYMKLRVS